MTHEWPIVPLGEVMSQFQEYIDSPEPREYPKLSVKLYGKGVVLDEPADGATLLMKRHQIAKAGQVILSEIWGKKGAIGFVPSEGEGALCTSHFFLFDVHTDKINPKWLQAIFTANYLQDQLDAEAKGTTGYAAVRPKNLLAATIPLPPLDEQRRLVARIETLAAKIEEARGLRRLAVEEAEALMNSALHKCFDDLAVSFGKVQIGTFADVKGGKRLPAGQSLVDTPTPYKYIRVADMQNHSVDTVGLKYVPEYIQPLISHYTISSEDVYITIAGTIDYPGIVPPELNGTNLTENAAKLVFHDRDAISKDYIVYAARSPQVQEQFSQKNYCRST